MGQGRRHDLNHQIFYRVIDSSDPLAGAPKDFLRRHHHHPETWYRILIDALCIVQDDSQDWETESANMANIYSNSYLTTAATAASDSHKGLFVDRWTRSVGQTGLKLPVDAHHITTSIHRPDESIFIRPRIYLAHKRFSNVENAGGRAEDTPLLTRAWAFQERLLPSRTLHFHAEELTWECKSAVKCECQQT